MDISLQIPILYIIPHLLKKYNSEINKALFSMMPHYYPLKEFKHNILILSGRPVTQAESRQ